MKIKKQIIYPIIAVSIGIILVLFFNQKNSYQFNNYLQSREKEVWQELATIGITQEKLNALREQYNNDMACKPRCSVRRNIKPSICQIVESVLQEFDVNGNEFSMLSMTDPSPAGATRDVIHINEKKFEQFPSDAQRFVLAHETHHILNNDEASKAALSKLLQEQGIQNENSCKPRNNFYRFVEERADIQAATTNPEYASAYVSFMETLLKLDGENPGITHPKNSDRLKLAQQINKQFNGAMA